MDVDGPGGGSRHPEGRISAVSGRWPVDGRGIARRTLHALSSGAPRRRGHRGCIRIAGIGRLRSGGKPSAYAESAPADAAVLGGPARLRALRFGGSTVALAEAERSASTPPLPLLPLPLE